MNKIVRNTVLTLASVLMLCFTALGQTHFIYFQSENNSPFYLKMDDSLISSNANGYMILHHLSEGGYTFVIGLAKKEIPEAAFRIQVGSSGNGGFLLKKHSGELRLVNIQNKDILKPEKVAIAAGNRIRKDAVEKISLSEKGKETKGGNAKSKSIASKESIEKENKKESYTFAGMLNAVTGDPMPSDINEIETSNLSMEEKDENKDVPIPTELNPKREKDLPPVKKEIKDKLGVFDQLLAANNSEEISEEKTVEPQISETATPKQKAINPVAVMPPSKKKNSSLVAQTSNSSKLSFLGFDNLEVVLDSSEENIKQSQDSFERNDKNSKTEEEKVKDKSSNGISFDQLLAKIDTSTDSSAKESVAHPFLRDKNNIECQGMVSDQYFNKIKRKIASKSSESSMLHTFTRYLSENKCLTILQIREIAYLFPSNSARLQFLKEAYPHCAEKINYKVLGKTLTELQYQKQLQAFIP